MTPLLIVLAFQQGVVPAAEVVSGADKDIGAAGVHIRHVSADSLGGDNAWHAVFSNRLDRLPRPVDAGIGDKPQN